MKCLLCAEETIKHLTDTISFNPRNNSVRQILASQVKDNKTVSERVKETHTWSDTY